LARVGVEKTNRVIVDFRDHGDYGVVLNVRPLLIRKHVIQLFPQILLMPFHVQPRQIIKRLLVQRFFHDVDKRRKLLPLRRQAGRFKNQGVKIFGCHVAENGKGGVRGVHAEIRVDLAVFQHAVSGVVIVNKNSVKFVPRVFNDVDVQY